MWWNVIRVGIAAVTLVAVSEAAQRRPRIGGLLPSLPLISILAFVMTWSRYHDVTVVSRLARETLILVPLGLVFFIPLALAERYGLGFWPAFTTGLALATVVVGGWLWLGPQV